MVTFFKKRNVDPKERLETILGSYSLPSFPSIVTDILAELRNPEVSATAIAEKMGLDPGLSVSVLQLANSAAFAPRQPVENLPQAIMMIGLSKLESVILPFAIRDIAPANSHPQLDIKRFWQTAARRAILAKSLAKLWSPGHEDECFLAGYLQDLALPFLLEVYPSEYADILELHEEDPSESLAELERKRFDWDHAEVAMWMLKEWGLAESLALAVGGHHGMLDEADVCPEAIRMSSLVMGKESTQDRETLAQALSAHSRPPADISAFLDTYELQAADLADILS